MDIQIPKSAAIVLNAQPYIALGTASVETKGSGPLPQPDSNQPMRQGVGIHQD